MSRERLNATIRIALGLTLLAAALFVVAAARPAPRLLGTYAAVLGTPQPMTSDGDVPALFVTLSHPAVVTFPPAWNVPDHVCMVVRLDRGPAPAVLEFNDYPPQARWDVEPERAVQFSPVDILFEDRDGATPVLAYAEVGAAITAHLPYRVNWFGRDLFTLERGQSAGGLLCYHFLAGDLSVIPFVHLITLKGRNFHPRQLPAFYFRYNTEPDPSHPPQTIDLHQEPIDAYLERLVSQAPFAVRPMTPAQIDQRATETGVRPSR
jgi:hypothetical protein